MTKPNIFNVARYIIENVGDMTTMKLQKLTYYCQAWSLAWDGEPLFEEDFQAWANGPVSPELYKKHAGTFRIGEDFLQEDHFEDFTDEQVETMRAVIRDYGGCSAMELSNMTHQERPWREARLGVADGERSTKVVDKEIMQEFYAGI
ncbi:type II toxin-antitoxin system antitoxin SocA domain-containing protein [Lactococcus garvieae]|uniref:Panacea domain-containing protein n=1 Tax=Lactococcus garvieae TaxID=1363 RepID=UPI0030CFF3EB